MRLRAALAAAAVLAAAGCSPAPEPDPVPRSCSTDDSLRDKVELALRQGYAATGKYGLSESAGEDGWLVAVEYTGGENGRAQAGVWFTRDAGSGQVFSVDEGAVNASSWGLGEEDATARRKADSGYALALECLAERGETVPASDT